MTPSRKAGVPSPDDRGDTLIEVLITVVIVGLVVVALIGGLLTSTANSVVHRNQTGIDVVLRNMTETAQNYIDTVAADGSRSHWVSCATGSTYPIVSNAFPDQAPAGSTISFFGTGFGAASEAVFTPVSPAGGTAVTLPAVYTGTAAGARVTVGLPAVGQPNALAAGTVYSVTPFDLPAQNGNPAFTSPSAASNFEIGSSVGVTPSTSDFANYTLSTSVQYWTGTGWTGDVGSCSFNANSNRQQISFTVADLEGGSHASDSATFVAANFTPLANLTNTTVSVPPANNPTTVGEAVTFTATVTVVGGSGTLPAGDTVTFYANGTPMCANTSVNVNGGGGTATCTHTFTATGTYSVTAVFNGDTSFSGSNSPIPVSEVVNGPGVIVTSTSLMSSQNPATTGQAISYIATVTPASGSVPISGDSVTFTDNGAPITGCTSQPLTGGGAGGSGTATCPVTYTTTTGSPHSIIATFTGDTSYAPSPSSVLTETVDQAATTSTSTQVTSSVSPSVTGQSVTFTATVTPASGNLPANGDTVTFQNNGASMGCDTQPLDGSTGTATCAYAFTTAGGSKLITARFSGDSTFQSSASAAFTQTVNPASTSTTFVTSGSNASGPSPAVVGQQVDYVVSVAVLSPGAGSLATTDTVEFFDGGSAISGCAAVQLSSSATATCPVTYPGTSGNPHVISAQYNPAGSDKNFATSTTGSSFSETVNPAKTMTALSGSAPGNSGHYTFTATVTVVAPGSGTLPTSTVNFYDNGQQFCQGTVSGTSNTATCPTSSWYGYKAGHTITAEYVGTSDYSSSTSNNWPK